MTVLQHGVDLRRDRDVGLNSERALTVVGSNFVGGRLGLRAVPTDQDNIRASGSQAGCDDLAQTLGTAGDQGSPPVKVKEFDSRIGHG